MITFRTTDKTKELAESENACSVTEQIWPELKSKMIQNIKLNETQGVPIANTNQEFDSDFHAHFSRATSSEIIHKIKQKNNDLKLTKIFTYNQGFKERNQEMKTIKTFMNK